MMALYNMTQLQAANTIPKLVIYANDSTSGGLIGLFMVAIFLIMLFIMKRWDFDKTLLASSWSCFVLSLLLTYAKLINLLFPLVFLTAAAFTMFAMTMTKQK